MLFYVTLNIALVHSLHNIAYTYIFDHSYCDYYYWTVYFKLW